MAKKTEVNFFFSALPQALEGFKFVHLSDLHLSSRTKSSFLEPIIQQINHFQPDLVCFTGDFLIRSTLTQEDLLIKFFNSIKAPFNFACLGNHDYHFDQKRVRPHEGLQTLLKKTPLKLLHNENTLICKKELQVVGLGDLYASKCLPKKAFENTDKNIFTLVLTHNPDSVPLITPFRSDLILAGHTHGGQLNIPVIWNVHTRLKYPQYKRGLIKVKNTQTYVNRGLGHHTLFRLFSPPEILLGTLKREVV